MATTSNFGWPTPDDTDLVRLGADAIRGLGDAVDATIAGGYLYAGTRYFESDGTFEKADPLLTGDIGLRAIRVRMVGGGGGGGGTEATTSSDFAAAGGGSSAAYCEKFYLAADLDASESVTVGAGGTGAGPGNVGGGTGGTSEFKGMSAPGGSGGQGMAATTLPRISTRNSAVSSASGGDVNLSGQSGYVGVALRNATGTNGGGSGAPSMFGGGGAATTDNATVSATPPDAFGSGGAGASNRGQAAKGGQTGGPGVVIFDVYV